MLGALVLPMMMPPTASAQVPAIVTTGNLPQEISDLTPKDLAKFLKKNFHFENDSDLFGRIDYWQSPEEFYKRRAGDCEDFALFTNYVFKMQGIESVVVSLYDGSGYGHTVTLFKENGKWNLMNEDRVYFYHASSVEEVLTLIHPLWTWAAVAKQSGNFGEAVKKIRNPNLA